MQKTGECYFRDDEGNLWIAESFCDKLGVVTTVSTQIQEQDKIMEWIIAHYQDVLAVIGGLVSVATIIVGLTPTTKDDEILGKIVRILDTLSVLPVKK